MSNFVGILYGVGNIFLLGYPQDFSLLNLKFRGISKQNESLVQKEESSYR